MTISKFYETNLAKNTLMILVFIFSAICLTSSTKDFNKVKSTYVTLENTDTKRDVTTFKPFFDSIKSFEKIAKNLTPIFSKFKKNRSNNNVVSGDSILSNSIEALHSLEPGMINVTQSTVGYHFSGISFSGISISIGVDLTQVPSGYTIFDVHTYWYDETNEHWVQLRRDSINAQKNIIYSFANKDGDYINAIIQAPESPETQGFVPTAMSDLKVGDPGTMIQTIEPPQPNKDGTAGLNYHIETPKGRQGMEPDLNIAYNSDGGNGWLGEGWSLSGLSSITVDTRWGVPKYDNTVETESYLLDGEALVMSDQTQRPTTSHHNIGVTRGTNDKPFYRRRENNFDRIERKGKSPKEYTWEVTDKAGKKYYFGGINKVDAVLRNGINGNIAEWKLRKVEDLFGNSVEYRYDVEEFDLTGNKIYNIKPVKILYSLSANDPNKTLHLYEIDINYNIINFTRKDLQINARYGYLSCSNRDLLSDIIVRLVKFKDRNETGYTLNQPIRKYEFKYSYGEYNKTVLSSISQYGYKSDGKDSLLFNSHNFNYYNLNDINNQIFKDPVEIDIPTNKLLGSSKTEPRIGVGGAVGIGVADGNFGSKSMSADGQFSYKENATTGTSAFVDIDGDGLPDFVEANGNTIRYIPNEIKKGKISFGNRSAIQNVTNFSLDKGTSTGGGWQVNGPTGSRIFGGIDYNTSNSYTQTYFADANGDGLIDIAEHGKVKFNTSNGLPGTIVFDGNSSNTGNRLTAGLSVDGALIMDATERDTQKKYNIKVSPLHDIVKVWIAPDTGEISISAPIKLLQPDITDFELEEKWRKADGILYSIQKNSTFIVNQSIINKTDTALRNIAAIPTHVDKGDFILFRLQSGTKDSSNGDFDKVIWDPTITYTKKPSDVFDLFSETPTEFKASSDYLASEGKIFLPDSGKLWSHSVLKKSHTRDSVYIKVHLFGYSITDSKDTTLEIKTNSDFRNDSIPAKDSIYHVIKNEYKLTDRVLFEKPLDTSAQTLSIDIDSTSYSSGSQLYVELIGASNLNFKSIKWVPDFFAKHPDTLNKFICYPQIAFKGNLIQHGTYFTSMDSGMVEIYPRIKLNKSINPQVKIIISDSNSVITKKIIKDSVSASEKIVINVNKNQTFFVHYEVDDLQQYVEESGLKPSFDAVFPDYKEWSVPLAGFYSFYAVNHGDLRKSKYKRNDSAFSAAINSDTLNKIFLQKGDKIFFIDTTNVQNHLPFKVQIPNGAGIFASWDRADLGNLYRGWGQAVFNGMQNLNSPINPSNLKVEKEQRDNLFDVSFFGMALDQKSFTLRGPNKEEYISGDTMSSSRLAMADVIPLDVFKLEMPPSNGASAPARYSKTSTKTTAFGAGGGSGNNGSGDSYVIADYIDMNGDKYPDFVSQKYVQYTNPLGGLSNGSAMNISALPENNINILPVSSIKSNGFNLGGNFDHPTKTNGGNKTEKPGNVSSGSASTTSTLGGLSLSGGINTNDDNAEQLLQDVNGDGLPDLVKRSAVYLNIGYQFSSKPINWNFNNLQLSHSDIISLGGGINIDNYSTSAGINYSTTKSFGNASIIDLNGDGLPDQVLNSGNLLTLQFNQGLNINQEKKDTLHNISEVSNTEAESFGINGSYTFAPWIPFTTLKAVFSFSANTSGGSSTTKSMFSDIDGDGYPDFVQIRDGSNKALVYINNLGKINRIDSIIRPLGGSFKIDYKHTEASYKHPGGKWVMASITKNDGLNDDGENPASVFDYNDGDYDRFEREFLGFGEIIQKDSLNGSIARQYIRHFDTKNYYTANNLLEDIVQDGKGNKFNVTKYTYYKRKRENVSSRAIVELQNIEKFSTGIIQTPLQTIRKYAYEGDSSKELLLSREDFIYDTLLNVRTYKYREGDSHSLDHTSFSTNIKYDPIHVDENVYGLPVSIEIKDSKGKLLRKQSAWYPESTPAKVFHYKIAADTLYFSKDNFAVNKYQYDDYGNLEQKVFPDNEFKTTFKYEADMFSYLSEIHEKYNPELVNVFETDLRFGVHISEELTNGRKIKTLLDAFGRPVRITGPRESVLADDSKAYTILIEYQHNATIPYSIVKHYDTLHESEGIYTISFIDGYKKPLQVKKSGILSGQQVWIVSGRQKFDQLYRAAESYYPTTEPYDVVNAKVGNRGRSFNPALDNISPTVTTYDLLDRIRSVNLPDKKIYSTNTYSILKDGFGNNALVTTTDYTNNHTHQKQVFTNGSGLTSSEAYFLDTAGKQKKITRYRYNPVHQLDSVSNNYKNDFYLVSANSYDWSGRRTDYYNISSGLVKYEYNSNDKIVKRVSAGGYVTKYSYIHNRLTGVDYPAHPEDSVRYWYGDREGENKGQVVFQIDATGAQSFSYDEFGHVIKNVRTVIAPFDSMYTFTTKYSYDNWNRMLRMVYPGGENVVYNYNTAGLLEKVYGTLPGNANPKFPYVDKIAYDKFEQRENIKYGNNTQTSYRYNDLRRTLKEVKTDDNAGNIITHSYTYDDLNNIESANNKSNARNGFLGISMSHIYTYDNQNQVSTATGIWNSNSKAYKLNIGYDDQMNISSRFLQLASEQVNRTINGVYTYLAANPLQLFSQRESVTRTRKPSELYAEVNNDLHYYDKEGRDIWTSTADSFQNTITERKIIWDEENRIRAVSNSGYLSSYTYDANNDRTIKLSAEIDGVYANGKSVINNIQPATYSMYVNPYFSVRNGNGIGTKHIYVGTERIVSQLTDYANWDQSSTEDATKRPLLQPVIKLKKELYSNADEVFVLYQQKITQSESVINGYFDSLQLPHQVLKHGAFQSWPPLQYPLIVDPAQPGFRGKVISAIDKDEKLQYFYHSNYLGSTSLVTDKTTQVVQYVEYLPFGETFMEQRKDYSSQFLFNGKEQDQETGLYYYGARYYDPHSYQWLGVDPMAEKYIGQSPYTFSFNNPLRMRDPNGKESNDEIIGATWEKELDKIKSEVNTPTISEKTEVSIKAYGGKEGKIFNIGVSESLENKITTKYKIGGVSFGNDKITAKVGGLSATLGLGESEFKLSVNNDYYGVKFNLSEDPQYFFGRTEKQNGLLIDVKTTIQSKQPPPMLVVPMRIPYPQFQIQPIRLPAIP